MKFLDGVFRTMIGKVFYGWIYVTFAVGGQPIAIELIGDVVNEFDRVVSSGVGVVVQEDSVYVKVETRCAGYFVQTMSSCGLSSM